MKADWSIIPDIEDIERFIKLADEYGAAFEYNDFFHPHVYESREETERRIAMYRSLGRDLSRDTLHGVFFDISVLSRDTVIRERSRELTEYSLDTAMKLDCRGVVFHTGMVFGLDTKEYNDSWLDGMDEYLHRLAPKYSGTDIYIENTFERSPGILEELMKRTEDLANVSICLDYAHAMLTSTKGSEWVRRLAPYIRHMHINDHDLKADLHLAAGDGKIDYADFKRIIEECGIKGTRILLEVNGYDKARRSLTYMNGI